MKFSKRHKNLSLILGVACLMVLGFQNCGPGFAPVGLQNSSSVFLADSVFKCDLNSDPSISSVNRLTKSEIIATYRSLVGQAVNADVVSKLNAIPSENAVQTFDNIGTSTSSDHVRGYFEAAIQAASTIVRTDAYLGTIVGSCAKADATLNESCLRTFISSFGLKALRRPLEAAEVASYITLFNSVGSTRKKVGLQLVIAGILQSPSFIYKLELQGQPQQGRPDLLQLTSHELASRLSYLFTGKNPDEELLRAAAAGELTTSDGIKAQASRLIAGDGAKAQFKKFYSQWLHFSEIPVSSENEVFIDGLIPKGLSEADALAARENLRSNAIDETSNFLDYHAWKNKSSYHEMMNSKLVFPLTADVAQIYGTSTIPSRDKPLADPASERQGLIGRAALLMHDTVESRPILRGVFVRTQLLCDAIPTPPVDVIDNARDAELNLDPLTSTRIETSIRTAGTSCASCHSLINPVGFALESFDALGRTRSTERVFDDAGMLIGSATINTGANLVIGSRVRPIKDAIDLASELANGVEAPACLSKQWFRFAYGRLEAPQDNCVLESSVQSLLKRDKSLQDMLIETALHPHFRLRKFVAQ